MQNREEANEIDRREQERLARDEVEGGQQTTDFLLRAQASVADAVMMLDLRHTNALLFKNAGTGRHNMVYRRADGSIGWVEPR